MLGFSQHRRNRVCGLLLEFWRNQSGAYVVMTALSAPLFLGMAGVGADVGLWLYKHRAMQSAADSGALSAASAYGAQANANLASQARAVAASYGFVSGLDGVTVTVSMPPQAGTHMTTAGAIEVVVQQPQPRFFSTLWGSQSAAVSARSVAVATPGFGCLLSLDATASAAISLVGVAEVALVGCSVYDNSSSATGLSVGSNSKLSARSVNVVGGISGRSSITASHGIHTGQIPAIDPYAGIAMPSFSGCNHNNYSTTSKVTLNPGVFCNGIKIEAKAEVTLNPGIYFIDRGELQISGQAKLIGSGVTLVFTSSTGNNWATAKFSGGSFINLTPPLTGPTAGIVMFGDRNMSLNKTFTLTGGGSQNLGGAVYLPKAAVVYSGGADSGSKCTQLIGNTISFAGNSKLQIDCTGQATKPVGAQASLVE